jgi:hypothetical protein
MINHDYTDLLRLQTLLMGQYIHQQIQLIKYISKEFFKTPKCFGTEVPSSRSVLEQSSKSLPVYTVSTGMFKMLEI